MNKKGNILVPIFAAIAVLALMTAGYFFWQNQQLQQNNQTYTPSTTNSPPKSPTPTPTTKDETTNWKTVQTIVDLELKYPNDWYLEESGSSQFPTVRIQNYPVQSVGGGAYNKGQFYFTIQHFPVGNSGIYSTEELIRRLPKAGDPFMYIGSSEKLAIYQQTAIKVGKYPGVHKVYGPVSSPNVKEEIYYVLNPNGSVILVEPKLDISSQKQTFDQILSTFHFLKWPREAPAKWGKNPQEVVK